MATELGRRSLAVALLGGTTAVGVGGYGWREYDRRNDLDLRLTGTNRSTDPVALTVLVLEHGRVFYERSSTLSAVEEGNQADAQHLAGAWIKNHRQYSLQISAVGESISVTNTEILDRLGADGWGVKRANVEIVITADRTIETNVSAPETE